MWQQRPFLSHLVLLVLWMSLMGITGASNVPCNATLQCELKLRPGSICMESGYCSNPLYHGGGCLKTMLGAKNWTRTRVCSSQDPPEAAANGYCLPASAAGHFSYQEIRLAGLNWETGIFVSWIIQIILSEVLNVPTTIDAGSPHVNIDLYNPKSEFDLSSIVLDYGWEGHAVADRVKDCRTVYTDDEDNYQQCFHVVPEMWWSTVLEEGKIVGIDPPRELGVLGENALFIPRFAAERDPTLVSYFGMRDRVKVAQTFQTPTRWKDFCAIQEDNCITPDAYNRWKTYCQLNNCIDKPHAPRFPENEQEEQSFFVEGLYPGHFRITEEGDCDLNPDTCTGVLVDYACGWNSYAKQQTHHLNMPFRYAGTEVNGGFKASEALQIWRAANATKSPVFMVWYSPDPFYQSFLGSEAEMTRVNLPPPTPQCADNRINVADYCANSTWRDQGSFGDPKGSCDTYPQLLQKTFTKALRDVTEDPSLSDVFWSPARDFLLNLRLDNLHYNELIQLWRSRGTDPLGYDPRDATCQWVVDNFDRLMSFVPETYPRVIKEVDNEREALLAVAFGLSIFVVCVVLLTTAFCFLKRKTMCIYHMQSHFLRLLLCGMLMVGIGAVIMTAAPTDASCGVTPWLINLGYLLLFVPLVVRISAISRLATDGKRMQRVRVKSIELYKYVLAFAVLVAVYLFVWTYVDPPVKTYEYELTNHVTPEGDSVIESYDYCGAEYDYYWLFIAMACRGLVLLSGTMIGFLALRVKDDRNDSRAIFVTLVVQLVVLVLQFVVCVILFESKRSDLMGYSSILHSLNAITPIAIYILPKFFDKDENKQGEDNMLPDVFVHTTMALLDVVGFSAWTSVRQPVDVFQFLEVLYETFDEIAVKNGVFKVETVGECYIAATGIPKPQPDHAVRMAKFAMDCMAKMPRFVKSMETRFGPDTGDLSLQIAMHSGPVTGGCLAGKGEKFQLFGATTFEAKLLLDKSISGRIHVSESTANLIVNGGKPNWIVPRDEKVSTGPTFWLDFGRRESAKEVKSDEFAYMNGQQRWVEWNVGVFQGLLVQILARRAMSFTAGLSSGSTVDFNKAEMPLEEVKEIIELPEFDRRAARRQRDNQDVVIADEVIAELREYISVIASLYNQYPFHNFAHASYVVMAVKKYMSRILEGSEAELGGEEERGRSSAQSALHDHSYGITSDPLTQFACVYSALIHDVQHPGVPNNRWMEENDELASRYKLRSVAEQNSFDVSWDLLMQDRFQKLRSTICSSSEELHRFRQIVINCVMATDLGDKQLKALRNGRWEKAFSQEATSVSGLSEVSSSSDSEDESYNPRRSANHAIKKRKQVSINRKATIVIEHLIQAADIAHTCQHWHIYRKWNERLFRELYQAYREGRSDANPADNWYKGEIGFFDFYIIPLSQKIRDCGVFGPTSDENLNYATNNRNMWKSEGQQIVEDMLKQVEQEYREQNESDRECAKDPSSSPFQCIDLELELGVVE
ncbi:Receptor-type guanylate cyclase gcy [Seminavis robusta]|uniref:Receptor-type guanylate cyclase gcy n=1 Tax=Seminavis robusta TaxID=568900 RepID=A0A9N8H4I5_9STRA|nr:Receptor-type guanylate cyclase gcy [Seminavis robusta]|eukprot:Sro50_g029180.1 Receptor-type guanylate cyclase gcy (1481) ;mRNA; f:100233-106140